MKLLNLRTFRQVSPPHRLMALRRVVLEDHRAHVIFYDKNLIINEFLYLTRLLQSFLGRLRMPWCDRIGPRQLSFDFRDSAVHRPAGGLSCLFTFPQVFERGLQSTTSRVLKDPENHEQ